MRLEMAGEMLTDELESWRLWWLCKWSLPPPTEVLLLTVELPVLPLLIAVLVVVALSAEPAEPAPAAVPALTRSCKHKPVDSADMASRPFRAPPTPTPSGVDETPWPPPTALPLLARSMPKYVGKMVENPWATAWCGWWWPCSVVCWWCGCSGGRWWSLPENFVVTTSLKCCKNVVVVVRPVSYTWGKFTIVKPFLTTSAAMRYASQIGVFAANGI